MPVEKEAGGATILAMAVMYDVVAGASKYIFRLTPTRRLGMTEDAIGGRFRE